MLCKNEPGDPYFFLHFFNIRNMITNWMKFEKFLLLPLLRGNHLNMPKISHVAACSGPSVSCQSTVWHNTIDYQFVII